MFICIYIHFCNDKKVQFERVEDQFMFFIDKRTEVEILILKAVRKKDTETSQIGRKILCFRRYLLVIEAQHDGRTPHRNEEDAIELKTILL